MTDMPALATERLMIRPFEPGDLQRAYQLFDVDLADANLGTDKQTSLTARSEWLSWAVLNYAQLAHLYQPPYGDRAIILRSSGELIGSCGFVPCLMPFEQIPGLSLDGLPVETGYTTTEFGLFYAISPAHQRQGYAFEASQALIQYAFTHLRLKRVVATTTYDNPGSVAVMRKLGMRVERNPFHDPPWLQVVGVLYNQG